MNFKVTKRCIRCRKPLRDDGTCQNEKCVRYTAPKEETSTDTNTTTGTTGEAKQQGRFDIEVNDLYIIVY